MFTRHNRYHGPHFTETYGTTQWTIASPIIFNVTVDIVVLRFLSLMVEYGATIQYGLGHALVRNLGVFYAYYVLLISWDLE